MIVEGAVGSLADDAELAPLHALNLGHLLQKDLRGLLIVHAKHIYHTIYHGNKKRPLFPNLKIFVLHPMFPVPIKTA